MKTKQELLDFYGVEVGKKYLITKTNSKVLNPKIFTIKEIEFVYGGLGLESEDGDIIAITMLNDCCYEEVKLPILDDVEREFLQKYVMNNPALKGKVAYITKIPLRSKSAEYIEITTTKYDDDFACFPCFKQNTMYKGMEVYKHYTPQELGLEE